MSESSLFPGELVKRLKRDFVLRIGVISAFASIVPLLVQSAVTHYYLEERLEDRVKEALIVRHQTSHLSADEVREEERRIAEAHRGELQIRYEGVYAWINSEGATFAGNVSGLDCRRGFYDGWLDTRIRSSHKPIPVLPESQVDSSVHDRFLFLAQRDGEYCLIFGRSLYDVDAVRHDFINLFLWLVPLSLLLAIAISLRQSFKLRERLQKLGNAVREIASGNLEARMPVEGDDDIDRLARSSNLSFDRLQESVNAMQQLTSVIAHDLRAPLNRVSIPLEDAVRANESGKTAVESLELVQNSLLDVRSVFDALLRISQIESGRRRSNFREIDLVDVAERIHEIYQPVVEDAGQTLDFVVTGEGSSKVQGDAELLAQMIVNIVENSARYAPRGSVISVCVHRHHSQPELIVQDNGHGLPEEERGRVLRRLYRFEKSTGGKSGHGLGLSLVKAVVDLHHGVVTLEDACPGLLVRIKF